MPFESSGPDIVVAGSARSGTSYVAAALGTHPAIDPSAVKEPDYFSRWFDRGPLWYDGLFTARRAGVWRLDASMSYTVPQYPEALARLAGAAPDAFVVYAVRDPLPRAFSHYRLLSSYFDREQGRTFAQALRDNPVYLGAGDYAVWLPKLYSLFPPERILVVPFPIMTRAGTVQSVISEVLGLEPQEGRAELAHAHRNEVVTFRHPALRMARRVMVHSGLHPWVRRHVGADRLRTWRRRMTRPVEAPSLTGELISLDADLVEQCVETTTRSIAAATRYLGAQDERLGLEWATEWKASLVDWHMGVDESTGPASGGHVR